MQASSAVDVGRSQQFTRLTQKRRSKKSSNMIQALAKIFTRGCSTSFSIRRRKFVQILGHTRARREGQRSQDGFQEEEQEGEEVQEQVEEEEVEARAVQFLLILVGLGLDSGTARSSEGIARRRWPRSRRAAEAGRDRGVHRQREPFGDANLTERFVWPRRSRSPSSTASTPRSSV